MTAADDAAAAAYDACRENLEVALRLARRLKLRERAAELERKLEHADRSRRSGVP